MLAVPHLTRNSPNELSTLHRRPIVILGRSVKLPQSRRLRITIGFCLIFFGTFGFLPILGFWMVPLGFLVLSYEFATVRRWRRRLVVRWERRRQAKNRRNRSPPAERNGGDAATSPALVKQPPGTGRQ